MKKEPKPTVLNLTEKDRARGRLKWKEATNSLDEVNVVNLISFLKPAQRIHFVNELCRVLKPGARAQVAAPHWCSARAMGDLMFEWPPVSEAWLHHLNADWRKTNAPWGKGYKCDFDVSGGYAMHPQIVPRNTEYQMHAVTFWKEAAQELLATLIKR